MTRLEHPTIQRLRMEYLMREQNQGSMWASVVAAMAVAGTLGLLYLPLVMK
jgi:hypothetical protein